MLNYKFLPRDVGLPVMARRIYVLGIKYFEPKIPTIRDAPYANQNTDVSWLDFDIDIPMQRA